MSAEARWSSPEGATAVEYALIMAAIVGIIILVVSVLGQQTKDGLCGASSAMEAVGSTANPNC